MKVVMIGAGQTGRGFIAPFIQNSGHEMVFIDQDEDLIRRLQAEKKYRVSYFGDVQPAVDINGFAAHHTNDSAAVAAIAAADLVTTSVFAGNISALLPLLRAGIEARRAAKKLQIVCIENGVNVKQPLIDAPLDAHISEGIIFCTSIRDAASLNIASQSYPDLPVDGAVPGIDFTIEGMPLVHNFPTLIQRKIYTYNFMSAAIAYLGSYAGYESYSDAANDCRIASLIEKCIEPLNRLIADKYEIPLEEQAKFAGLAIKKFQNRWIADSICRNAQQASRKLGANERILSPIAFAIERAAPTKYFSLVAAAALHYGAVKEGLDVPAKLTELKAAIRSETTLDEIAQFYSLFNHGEELAAICRIAADA